MSSAHPPQRGQQGGGGKAPHSMANVLKIYHNKSLQDEAYAKTLKSYDWNAPLPPRGYIFGVGRGAKPLNSSNNGVVVGAGSKSEHGGLSASQLSYFDALDSIEMKQHRARAKTKSGDDADGFQTPAAAAAAAPDGVDNNNSIMNGATATVKLSLENLASMERTKVAKALKGSLRDDDAGELAEETFFADDAGAEAGLDRLARKRLLGGLMDSTASVSVTGTKASASGTAGDATKNISLSKKSVRRLICTSEQLKEVLTTGDESNPATWIRRARAAFDAQELGGGAVVGAGIARSTAESLRILDRSVRKGGRGSLQGPVASQGPHIWREKLFAILKWGHYCEEGDDLDDDEHAQGDAQTTSALDVMARERRSLVSTRCSLKSLDLLKGLQSPSRFKIPVAFLGPARETIAEAVTACPSSVELWTYAIALQPTQIAANLQSQAALAANPTCVPLYRYTIAQLDAFDDRLALAKAGLERNPFSEEMLVLASSLYEQQRHSPQSLTSARSLFLSAAGRYAREHASRLPPLPIMFEAILLEDRELFGALRPLGNGEGLALCHDQLDSLKRAEQLGQLSLPWMDLVDVSGTRTSKIGGGDPQQQFLQLKHLLAIIGGGQHGISKIVSKTAKIHLIDAVSRKTFEASTAKAAILKEISIREQNAATNSQEVSSLFSEFSLAELKEMLANACSTIAVRGYVVSEWVGLAVEAATRGNIVAGALMLRELLKMQSSTPPSSSSCAPSASGPAPAEDFSTLSASWCSDFIALCLNRHHGKDSAGRNLRLLASLVESLSTQRAPAVTLQAQELAMRQQEAANKRSHAFVNEILHFQRENKRKEAASDGDGGRYRTDRPMSTSGPCLGSEYVAIEDGGACGALFGRDCHSSSSSNSASAGVTSNTKALVILMVWVIALIGLSSPLRLACCPTESSSDALEDCKSPTDNAGVGIHVGEHKGIDFGLPELVAEGSTGSEVKNRDVSTSNFDQAVGRATSLRAVAGLIQVFTSEVSSTMAKWEKSREKQKIAEKALAAARRSGDSTALMTSISTQFAPIRMLFSTSHRLGKFLELLLNTTHHLSIERSIGAAQRLVYYCGWGYGPDGCPPLLGTEALTASSSRSENFSTVAAETDIAIGVKREGIDNNENPNVSPSSAIAGGQQQAQLGHTLGAGVAGPWWSATRTQTEDNDTKLNDKPLLWNSSTLKSIATVYAQRGGRGFVEGADAAEAFTSGHASSNVDSPFYTTSLFDEAVRTVQHIADYSRIISSLFADARRFSESLMTLSHTLALLVRFSYCVPLQNPSESTLEEHILTDTLSSPSLLSSCSAPLCDNNLDVKSKVKAITRLLEARRTLVSNLLMRVSVVPGVESLVLAVCTLLQQSADHQNELYDAAAAVADRLHAAVAVVARIRKDSECDNANVFEDAPRPAITISAEGAEALQPILRSLYSAAQKIAEEERDLIVLSREGEAFSSAAPPSVAVVGESVRALLDSFLLPKIGCERAAGLSSFAERHFSATSYALVPGGSSADSTSLSHQIARNVGLACINDLGKGPARVSGASSPGESILISAAIRASVLPDIPPVLLSVSALLKQARVARSQILAAEYKTNEATEPKLASSLPVLPPHLWSLLKSERLWHHRVVAERYYAKATDMMSTPIASLLAEVTAASALQEAEGAGRGSRHGDNQLRIEDRASKDAADFVYSYSPIACKLSAAHTKMSKALASLARGADLFESKVPFNTKDALSSLLKALDPIIGRCASDARAYNGVVEQLTKALVIQHQQQSEGGAAAQYSLASTVFDAPTSVTQLISTAIGSSSATNGGLSIKSRALWAFGAEESVSTAKKRIAIANQCRHVFTVNPQSLRSNVHATQTSHYALELASQMVSQASKSLRSVCDDVLKLSSIVGSSGAAPPLPKAVNLALRLSTGPPTGFADIVNLNSKLTGSTPSEAVDSPTGGRGLTPLLSLPMGTVVECATAVGREACRSLLPIESDLYLASNTVALEAFADTLSDHQAARALLDRCEGFVREYMTVVNTKRTEIDRKVEGLESQLAKEVSRETALRHAASGASIEFNKRMLAGAGRGVSSSSAGSLLTIDHRKSLEEDLLYQSAVKEHITDAVYYKLLRCLFIVLKAKIDLERLTALGGLAKTKCLFMNKACLPQNKVNAVASSSDAIAQQQHSLSSAVSSLIPSALHRETLSLIKGIASSTITPHMVELAKSFIRQRCPSPADSANNGGHPSTNTFTDYLSRLGLEGLVEVLSLWIEYEVPRERSVAIATVMNRLMSRHPHTYLSVGRMFYSGHKYAKASQEYLKAVDHSHGCSCDAWLSIVFTMRECQRLLKDALRVFTDTVEGRRDTGDAVEDALFHQQHKLTPVLLRAASTGFTSAVEFVAEEMLRPILEQLFGSVSVGEVTATPTSSYSYSELLLPAGYSAVGGSLATESEGSVVVAACARGESIVRRVSAAADACAEMAMSQIHGALEAHNSRVLERSGGLSLSLSAAPIGRRNTLLIPSDLKSNGTLWSFVINSSMRESESATGVRRPFNELVASALSNFTASSLPSSAQEH